MKRITTLFAFLLIVACGGKEKNDKKDNNDYMKPNSTGRINHIIIVVEDNLWKGEAGNALREVIKKPIKGLPQLEYQFNITTIPPTAFTKMFKNSRNLLFLKLANKEALEPSIDKYSQPQTILKVEAPTTKGLVTLINTKTSEIINIFKNQDLKSLQKEIAKNEYTKKINTLNKLGITMNIPNKYRIVIDTLGSFMWMRSHIPGGIATGDQTNNVIVYQAPLFDDRTPILQQIIKNRDSIGKAYIRGNNADKMYMITEAARTPDLKKITFDGKKAYETRGTWEVFGAFSAGPFLNYSIIDEKNNRVIVIEGFNYAPSVNKRDFVFELEAILKTAKIN